MNARVFTLRYCILTQQTKAIKDSLMKSKESRNVEISRCIAGLSDAKNDFITDCFINLAKWDFRLKFLKWFLENKVNVYTEKGEDKEKEINDSITKTEYPRVSTLLNTFQTLRSLWKTDLSNITSRQQR